MRAWWDEQPKKLLAVLLAVDLAFIAVHVIADERRGSLYSLYTDTGPAGLWGVGKAFAAAWIVYEVFRRTEFTVYLAWAVTFVTVALDDFAEIHEIVGIGLDNRIGLPSVLGLRGTDLGELIVWALIGIPLLAAIGATVGKADERGRRDSVAFFWIMAVLVVVGAGFDALHMAIVEDYEAVSALGVLEDGGELLVLSVLVTTAVAVRAARPRPTGARPVPTAPRTAAGS